MEKEKRKLLEKLLKRIGNFGRKNSSKIGRETHGIIAHCAVQRFWDTDILKKPDKVINRLKRIINEANG